MTTQKKGCPVIAGREHVVRSEIENSNYGALLATYR
ncbi:hypothetical protein ABID62_009453 [Bradyrhizobium sp. S3.9.1]|jgi:hypothetical protein